MERYEESLSTRDLAGTGREAPVEPANEPTPDEGSRAAQDERVDRDSAAGGPVAGREREATAEPPTARPGDGTRRLEPDAPAPGSAEPAVTATKVAPERAHDAVEDIDEPGSLLPDSEEFDFQRRWEEIQTRFVDDPRQAVEDADALVAGVMQRIAEGFAQARDGLEGQWSRGEDVGTEELRVALQRYRAFFRRLLSA
jgi:hypothetical protein